jgi:hypothetical protein
MQSIVHCEPMRRRADASSCMPYALLHALRPRPTVLRISMAWHGMSTSTEEMMNVMYGNQSINQSTDPPYNMCLEHLQTTNFGRLRVRVRVRALTTHEDHVVPGQLTGTGHVDMVNRFIPVPSHTSSHTLAASKLPRFLCRAPPLSSFNF